MSKLEVPFFTNNIQKKDDGLRISAFGSKLRYASISSHHMNARA